MDEELLKSWTQATVIVDVFLNGQYHEELSFLAARLLRAERDAIWDRAVSATVHEELVNDLADPEFPALRLTGPSYLAPEVSDA